MDNSTTLADLVSRYIRERQARADWTPDTVRNNRCMLYGFARSFGARPVARLGQRDVERWLETIAHLSPATRRGRFTVVHNFCRWLIQRGHIRRDPMAELRAPKQPRAVPRHLPAEAVAATLEQCPDTRARLMVILEVQQGLRCCEVSNLQLGDLDRASGWMRVVGKGGHQRVLPIMAETIEALDDYLAEHPATAGPLVRSYRDPSRALKPDAISRLVTSYMAAAGIKKRPRDGVSAHALRHTAATDTLNNGAHLRDVQHFLGHAHLATTEIYLAYVVHGLEHAMGGRRYGLRRGQLRLAVDGPAA